MLVPWTTLRPSDQARRRRRVGSGIAGVTSLALLAAAIASTPFDTRVAMLALAGGVVAGWAWLEPSGGTYEIGVSAVGEIVLRDCNAPASAAVAEPRLKVSFAGPWLISLRRGTILIPVWPDSVPPAVFRQLWVHLRWGRAGRHNNEQPSKRTRGGAFTNS